MISEISEMPVLCVNYPAIMLNVLFCKNECLKPCRSVLYKIYIETVTL